MTESINLETTIELLRMAKEAITEENAADLRKQSTCMGTHALAIMSETGTSFSLCYDSRECILKYVAANMRQYCLMPLEGNPLYEASRAKAKT